MVGQVPSSSLGKVFQWTFSVSFYLSFSISLSLPRSLFLSLFVRKNKHVCVTICSEIMMFLRVKSRKIICLLQEIISLPQREGGKRGEKGVKIVSCVYKVILYRRDTNCLGPTAFDKGFSLPKQLSSILVNLNSCRRSKQGFRSGWFFFPDPEPSFEKKQNPDPTCEKKKPGSGSHVIFT